MLSGPPAAVHVSDCGHISHATQPMLPTTALCYLFYLLHSLWVIVIQTLVLHPLHSTQSVS